MARTACQPPLRSRLKALGGRERKDGAMAVPQLLSDIIRVLLLLAPAAALVALVLAGISLTREGGTTFIIGATFTNGVFWPVFSLTPGPSLLLSTPF